MPIDTPNKQLALLNFAQPWLLNTLRSPGVLDPQDQLQLLWGYPQVVFVPPAVGKHEYFRAVTSIHRGIGVDLVVYATIRTQTTLSQTVHIDTGIHQTAREAAGINRGIRTETEG